MRRRTMIGKPWLRAALVVSCLPATSAVAQDRFIHQPTQSSVKAIAKEQTQLDASRRVIPQVPASSSPIFGSSLYLNQSAPTPSLEWDARTAQRTFVAQPNSNPVESTPVARNTTSPQRDPLAAFRPAPASPASTPQPQANNHELQANTHGSSPTRATAPRASAAAQSLQWVSKSAEEGLANVNVSKAPVPQSHQFVAVSTQQLDQPNHPQPGQPNYQTVTPLDREMSQQRFAEIETRMLEWESKLSASVGDSQAVVDKSTVAMLVSSKILNDPKFSSDRQSRLEISPVETPHGWQAIGQQLTAKLTLCEGLIGRGAYYSAREEAEAGALLLLRHLDLIGNACYSEPTWLAAQQALSEAEGFVVAQASSADAGQMKRLIDSHETSLLKGVDVDEVSPAIAAQHYRLLAEQLLVDAAQKHPWASELYYVMGRACQAEADQNQEQADSLRAQALCYYRAARATQPTNAIACNQLGFLLLQMDRPAEARDAIAAALTQRREDAFLCNMVEASRRLGDTATQHWARQTLAYLRSSQPVQGNEPQVIELNPQEFAKLSPYAGSPQSATPTPAPALAPSSNHNRTAMAPMSGGLR